GRGCVRSLVRSLPGLSSEGGGHRHAGRGRWAAVARLALVEAAGPETGGVAILGRSHGLVALQPVGDHGGDDGRGVLVVAASSAGGATPAPIVSGAVGRVRVLPQRLGDQVSQGAHRSSSRVDGSNTNVFGAIAFPRATRAARA